MLVILGLLVGGVLTGQSLIRAAELRAIPTEYNRYVTAARAFKDKYFFLPGDMRNATTFWGAQSGDDGDGIGSDCRRDSATAATCNGDGDGLIKGYPDSTTGTPEDFLFWKHLQNAGLIEGNYSGAAADFPGSNVCPGSGVPGNNVAVGCNVPSSKMGGGAFWYPYGFAGKLVGDGFLFDGSYGNFLMVTNAGGYVANDTYGAHFLKPEDAWSIDTKMDDGKPGTGSIIGSRWLYCTTGAATSADVTLATYIFNGPPSTAYCVLVFRNAF